MNTNNQQPTTNNIKKGILLVNLGSPKSTKVEDVKEYLDEFLMDERVIDYPWFFRALLVKELSSILVLKSLRQLTKQYGLMKVRH